MLPIFRELNESREMFNESLSADAQTKLNLALVRFALIIGMAATERRHIAQSFLIPKLRQHGVEAGWLLHHIKSLQVVVVTPLRESPFSHNETF